MTILLWIELILCNINTVLSWDQTLLRTLTRINVRGKCRYWPVTMLNADHIDSISAARIILAEILNNNKIVAVDQLDDEFLEYGRHQGQAPPPTKHLQLVEWI